jgi:hypothetical protein
MNLMSLNSVFFKKTLEVVDAFRNSRIPLSRLGKGGGILYLLSVLFYTFFVFNLVNIAVDLSGENPCTIEDDLMNLE